MLWAFSTIGLCNLQERRHRRFVTWSSCWCRTIGRKRIPFRRALVLLLITAGKPCQAGIGHRWPPPPILDWLAIAAEEVGALINQGSTFAIGDTLTLGPGNARWTESKLGRSAILPPPPQMLAVGFGHYDSDVGATSAVAPDQWHTTPGTREHAYGFYWLLPLSETEYVRANSHGTWNVFAEHRRRRFKRGQ